jgi:RNA polymerase sigma factor (sigma-70 family)
VTALRALPKRQREAVVLRYIVDLSEHETAAAMGCARGTVKSAAARGLERLRHTLGPSWALEER